MSAGDRLDLEPRLLEQPIEHAPGEGAKGPAALKGEVDKDWLTRRFPRADTASCHDLQPQERSAPGRLYPSMVFL